MLGRLGLPRAWWAHASIDSSRDRLKYFISDERITLAQLETGMVSALDNANGHRLWAVQVGDPHEVRFRAVTNDHLVLLISGANMYALNKFTGDVAWMVKVPTAVSTPPGLDETRAYVGTISGTVYAYDLVFLEKLSKDPRLAADMYHSLKWQYKTGRADHVSADQHGKGRGCGECRCLALRPGRGQPEVAFSVRRRTSPFRADHADRQTDLRGDRGPQGLLPRRGVGALKWELLSGLRIGKRLRVVEDRVYLRPEGYGCAACRPRRESLWSNRQALTFLAATPAVVYASDVLGNVLLLNPKDGRQIGAFRCGNFRFALPTSGPIGSIWHPATA